MVRLKLQQHLDQRILQHPVCNSWFANDLRGNQVALIYAVAPDTVTIGRNYSYRTYFHGGDQDRKQQLGEEMVFNIAPWGQERQIIDQPHLSSVFLSKGTYTWKVAFSVPIRVTNEKGQTRTVGVVACTSDMGNFVDFENGESQYAMLVDGRGSLEQCVILEHPLFDELVAEKKKIPRETLDLNQVHQTGRLVDPLGHLPEGESYRREWIAARQLVAPMAKRIESSMDGPSENRKSAGLFVVVAEEYGAVIEPVKQLSSRLIWLAIFAAGFFLFIALTMWLFVLRLLKDTNFRLSRSFSSGTTDGVAAFPSNTVSDRRKQPTS